MSATRNQCFELALGSALAALLLSAVPAAAAPSTGDDAPANGAAEPPPAAAEPATAEPPADEAKPKLPWKLGPVSLSLDHGVKLDLPAGHQFLGQPEAGKIMQKMGNLYNDNLLGIVVPSGSETDYFITMRYDEEGYVKDDDKLDADAILKAIKDGEAQYNEERKKAGFGPIHAEGWKESPRYDKASHHVVWGLLIHGDQGSSINYNTRVLGRKGYVSVNLVTDGEHLAEHKAAASGVLAGTGFGSGARYEDFNASTDKVAEYGLTGLVLGGVGLGVAKLVKIGLLAKFGKVLLAALIAGKKAIIAFVVAGIAGLKKWLARRGARDA